MSRKSLNKNIEYPNFDEIVNFPLKVKEENYGEIKTFIMNKDFKLIQQTSSDKEFKKPSFKNKGVKKLSTNNENTLNSIVSSDLKENNLLFSSPKVDAKNLKNVQHYFVDQLTPISKDCIENTKLNSSLLSSSPMVTRSRLSNILNAEINQISPNVSLENIVTLETKVRFTEGVKLMASDNV